MRSGFRRAPRLATVVLCALSLALNGGCRSGSEHDLVLRELRMQEDQLYAMEDYLNQYQSLLRQARAENRELKNRLATESNELPMPSPSRRATAAPPAEPPSPPAPTTPEAPSTPQPGPVEMPDVPGLDETISLPDGEEPATLSWGQERGGESAVVPAAWLAEEEGEAASVSGAQSAPATAPAERIELEVEIVAADPGTTRLIVDVVPTTTEGMPGSLAGSLSLMILGIEAGSEPTALARWDFEAPELGDIADQSPEGRHRFHLELPADAPEGRVQLWSRFLPKAGPKMLASADLRLDSVGRFSSAGFSAATAANVGEPGPIRDTAIVKAAAGSQGARERFIDVEDGTWAVATPGQRPSETTHGGTNWQRSREPFPHRGPRVNASPAARPEILAREAAKERVSSPVGLSSRRYALPTWSHERAAPKDRMSRAQETAVSAPAWSPER